MLSILANLTSEVGSLRLPTFIFLITFISFRIDATTLKDLDAAGCEAVAATWRQDDNTVFPVFVSATSGSATPRFAKPSLQPGDRMTTPSCELSNTSGSGTVFIH